MSLFEALSVIISFLGFGGTVTAIFVAHGQLKKMATSADASTTANKIATLATVLQIEDIISQRLREIENQAAVIEAHESGWTLEQKKAAKANYEGAVQHYLNAMDRLCACFLRGMLPEEDYRRDYQEQLPRTIETYERYLGGANDRFNNIRLLRDKWRG